MTREERWQRIRDLAQEYVALMHLDRWDVDVYQDVPQGDDAAGCHAEPEYRRATLGFKVDEISDDLVHRFVRHEMLHIPLWPLTHAAYFLAGDDAVKQEMVRLALESVVSDIETWSCWDRLVP